MLPAEPIFDDVIVSATALNRHPGEILDQALKKFVTIMRNDQAFVLLRRDRAAQLVSEVHHATVVLDLLHAVLRYVLEGRLDPMGDQEWVTVFGRDELTELVAETLAAFHRARSGEASWDDFAAVLHEWHESALVVRSESLKDAFGAVGEEVPLTVPPPQSEGELTS
jgi:hypothetical protein